MAPLTSAHVWVNTQEAEAHCAALTAHGAVVQAASVLDLYLRQAERGWRHSAGLAIGAGVAPFRRHASLRRGRLAPQAAPDQRLEKYPPALAALGCDRAWQTAAVVDVPDSDKRYERVQATGAALDEAWNKESHSTPEGIARINGAIGAHDDALRALAAAWNMQEGGARPSLSELDDAGIAGDDGELAEPELGGPDF